MLGIHSPSTALAHQVRLKNPGMQIEKAVSFWRHPCLSEVWIKILHDVPVTSRESTMDAYIVLVSIIANVAKTKLSVLYGSKLIVDAQRNHIKLQTES